MTAVVPERLVHRYQPVGSALELFRSKEPEVLLSGSAGTGKSRACLEKLHAMCLRYPGMRGLLLRKTAVSLTSTALVTYREIVAKEAIASGEVDFYGGSRQEAASYRYANGSTITLGGLDRATRIMSSEYDVCYVQEATELTQDDWEAVTTRLRNGRTPFMQLMADCNPGPPTHWLKHRCDAGQCKMIACRHEDNPRFYRDGVWTPEGKTYLDRLDALSGVRKERLRYGRWAAAEGLIYDTFDPAVHLYKPLGNPPKEWRRFLSIDFGFNNPFVCQWWAMDPDGRLYMYREIYMTGRIVEDHARQILALIKRGDGHRKDEDPEAIICDHDAEDRATLERHLGRSTVPAKKDVKPGIEAVQARLRIRKDGRPGIYICRDALAERDPSLYEARKPWCTEQEVTEYIWDPASPPAMAGTARETPLKRNDHGMDGTRYMVAHEDLRARARFRYL